MKYLEKLKNKWGLQSFKQVLKVLLVFTFAGSTAVLLKKYYFLALGFDAETAFWLKTLAYIVFLFPAYQILLLAYGFLLGEFDFFWQKERKMFLAVKNRLIRS